MEKEYLMKQTPKAGRASWKEDKYLRVMQQDWAVLGLHGRRVQRNFWDETWHCLVTLLVPRQRRCGGGALTTAASDPLWKVCSNCQLWHKLLLAPGGGTQFTFDGKGNKNKKQEQTQREKKKILGSQLTFLPSLSMIIQWCHILIVYFSTPNLMFPNCNFYFFKISICSLAGSISITCLHRTLTI